MTEEHQPPSPAELTEELTGHLIRMSRAHHSYTRILSNFLPESEAKALAADAIKAKRLTPGLRALMENFQLLPRERRYLAKLEAELAVHSRRVCELIEEFPGEFAPQGDEYLPGGVKMPSLEQKRERTASTPVTVMGRDGPVMFSPAPPAGPVREEGENAPDCSKCETEIPNTDSGGTWLTEAYWDCECEKDYIHPKTEKSCGDCGMDELEDGMPDSHVHEVAKYVDRPLCPDCQVKNAA